MICGFIDTMRAKGHTVESICRVLSEQGCQIAARTYRAWKRGHQQVAVRTITDAQVVRDLAWAVAHHRRHHERSEHCPRPQLRPGGAVRHRPHRHPRHQNRQAHHRAAENAYLKLARHTEHLHAPRPWKRNEPAHIFQTSGTAGLSEHLDHVSPLSGRIIARHLAISRDLGNNAETDLAALREIAHLIAAPQPRNMAPLARQLIEDLALDLPTVNRELAEAAAPRAPTPARPQINVTSAERTHRPAS